MDEINIWQTARSLIEKNGLLAGDQACDRIRELCAAGDTGGCAVWARILAAINELQRTEHRDVKWIN